MNKGMAYIIIGILFIAFGTFLVQHGRTYLALQNGTKLSEHITELDTKSRSEILSNINLKKEEIVSILKKQSKDNASDIIMSTIQELEIIQKDLDLKGKKLIDIETNTNNIKTIIDKESKNINLKNFSISLLTDIYDENAVSLLKNIPKSQNFKIWIKFKQNNLEMLTRIESTDQWYSNRDINNEEENYEKKFEVIPAKHRIIIRNGELSVIKSNNLKKFNSENKIYFELYHSGGFNFDDNFFHITIKSTEGESIKAKNIELQNIPFRHVEKTNIGLIVTETSNAITGYFIFN